jgi:hypothetical protein
LGGFLQQAARQSGTITAMNAEVEQLIEKLQALPPERRAEVEDFVDFLSAKARKQAAFDRLLSIADQLAATGAPPMTEDQVNAEIKAARAERRARAPRVDRP